MIESNARILPPRIPGLDDTSTPLECAIEGAKALSPYLKNLMGRYPDIVEALTSNAPDVVFQKTVADFEAGKESERDAAKALRVFKSEAHLLTALADLSGIWDWVAVTRTLSNVADRCTQRALEIAWQAAAEKSWVESEVEGTPGLFVIALGKHGADELNYSSDVDLAAFYDPDTFPAKDRAAGHAASKIIQHMTQLLENRTEDGYVFRVDLRLRPDPRSTPVAVSTQMAENYYESIGQNWERMVWIKARFCAGDGGAAREFIDLMQPFVWRRHLDFWAISDIHAIKRQIHSHGGHGDLSDPACDVKLGRGGIREIEFFTQTQQLILGGREPELRESRTISGLTRLTEGGFVASETRASLDAAYGFLRGVEHRIQMVNDEQTHDLPNDDEKRDRIAALSGFKTLEEFDESVRLVRTEVHRIYSDLFAQEERLSGAVGNLVFTGVDDDPGTVRTLEEFGFKDPSAIIERMRTWHRGSISATRTSRGRQVFTAITPILFEEMAALGEPDLAFAGFGRFLEGLAYGVQVLSLMMANPNLTRALVSTFTLSPHFAAQLASRPDTLDAMLNGGFSSSLETDACGFIGEIEAAVDMPYFEDSLNQARRSFRDESFRIGFQLMQGHSTVAEAEAAYTRLAETCLHVLGRVAESEVQRKFGECAGEWSVCGFGRLGAGELTATSDLDIVLIYDADGAEARNYFTKLTQRLITALSAATEEGLLYEVDLQLRPSGGAGPVAVQASSMERYYAEDAWTWEFMALTRFRPITGSVGLNKRLNKIIQGHLTTPRDPERLLADVLDMRRRLYKDRRGKGHWDLKLHEGGLLDIDFVSQYLQLREAAQNQAILSVKTETALQNAVAAGVLDAKAGAALIEAYHLQSGLIHLQRVAFGMQGGGDQAPHSLALEKRLCDYANETSFDALEAHLADAQARAAAIRCEFIGPIATED